MKTFKRLFILAVLGVVLMLLGSCDQWISVTIRVVNDSPSATVWAYIEYDDGTRTLEYPISNGGTNYRDFDISFYDADKYGAITIVVDDGLSYYIDGNVAENDWLTVVTYTGGGFYHY